MPISQIVLVLAFPLTTLGAGLFVAWIARRHP